MRKRWFQSDRAIWFGWMSGTLCVLAIAGWAQSVMMADSTVGSSIALRNAAVLAVLALLAEQMSIAVSDKVSMAASHLPILLAVMFTGRFWAIAVACLVGAWGCWRESSAAAAFFNFGAVGTSTFLASFVYDHATEQLGLATTNLSGSLLLCGAVAGVVYLTANWLLVGLGVALKYARTARSFWREEVRPFLQSVAVLASLGIAVAALYIQAGAVAVALLFVPLFASQYMFGLLVGEREHLARQRKLTDQYLEMNIGLAIAMVVLLDSKDEYTASHSAAVAMYCRDIAEALDLSESEVETIHLAGLLHDLGKVGTPDAVLGKSGDLTEEEWVFIRQHPEKGAEVLSHLAAYHGIADIVRCHHERLDGSGYPKGLQAHEIPELSKILAVVDTYHAMTSDRPYKEARSSFEALKELRRLADVSLAGEYIEVLAKVLRDKDVAYRDGSATDFMSEYERGRINLRLRGAALADVADLSVPAEGSAAS